MSILYTLIMSHLFHYPPQSSSCRNSTELVLLSSDFESPSFLLLLSLLTQLNMVLVSQHRRLASPALHRESWTASCRASAEKGELHLVGIVSHDLSSVARRQGDTRPAGTVQLQAQGICQRQILLNLHLL